MPRGRRPSIPLAIRFRKFFVQGEPDECWLWTGTRNPIASGGHGRLQGEGAKRLVLAHRVAYELHHGVTLEPDIKVLHRCDVANCVNPAHLFLGSQQANLADMYAKGRGPDVSGAKNPRAKLTEDDVRAIRKLRATGRTQRSIAADYGVSSKLIGMILRRNIWTHLD